MRTVTFIEASEVTPGMVIKLQDFGSSTMTVHSTFTMHNGQIELVIEDYEYFSTQIYLPYDEFILISA